MAVKKLKKKNINTEEKKSYICFHCEEELEETNFYNSKSKAYKTKIPICKTCLLKLFCELQEDYNSIYKAIFRICGLFDIYYYKNTIDSTYDKYKDLNKSDISSVMQEYMKQINSLPQYKNLTFQDSDVVSKEANVETMVTNGKDENVKKWGIGYKPAQYDILNDKYEKWCLTSPHEVQSDILALENICKLDLIINEKMLRKEDTSKYMKQQAEYIKQSGLDGKTRQKIEDGSKSTECFGSFIKQIETTRPCEVHSDKELYKDWEGHGKKYKDFYIRPLRNMVENRRDFPNVERKK